MLKVGIKYCGGCNPYYDRMALVKRIERRLQGKIEIVALEHDQIDMVLAVVGCSTACAELSPFNGKDISVITKPEDAEAVIRQILG